MIYSGMAVAQVGPQIDAPGRQFGGEGRARLQWAADHGERLALGDGDGVGPGGLAVVAGARCR